jgi:hypothetical protein
METRTAFATLIAERAKPRRARWTRFPATLSAANHPMQFSPEPPSKIESAQEGFGADKAYNGVMFDEFGDALFGGFLIFYSGPQPNIPRPLCPCR